MIVATHQPIFLPWPGFFCKALRADLVVLLDEVQFPLGRSWMTRNRLKSDQGELWLRVPVRRKGRGGQLIRDVEIHAGTDWRKAHLRSLRHLYRNAPYWEDHRPALELIYERGQHRLVDLNLALIRCLWGGFGLAGQPRLQSQLGVSGRGSELIVAICRATGADRYLSLPSAEKYLDRALLQQHGIEPLRLRFEPPVYPQLWGAFRYNLSALDLLLNCGPKGRAILIRAQ